MLPTIYRGLIEIYNLNPRTSCSFNNRHSLRTKHQSVILQLCDFEISKIPPCKMNNISLPLVISIPDNCPSSTKLRHSLPFHHLKENMLRVNLTMPFILLIQFLMIRHSAVVYPNNPLPIKPHIKRMGILNRHSPYTRPTGMENPTLPILRNVKGSGDWSNFLNYLLPIT